MREINRKKSLLDSHGSVSKIITKDLDEWFRVELTYTSNAIEGNTLTRLETASVIEKGLTVAGKSLQEHQEAINLAEAFTYIQELAKRKTRSEILLSDILDIHKLVLYKIADSEAGRLRNSPVRIAGSTTILPNPVKVPELMEELVSWLQTTSGDSVQIAADVHYRLVTIHPFSDGNGRTARLLMNLILIQAGFPPAIIKKEERNRYLTVLESAQTTGNSKAYYELIYDAVERSLDVYLETIKTQTTESAKKEQEQIFFTTIDVASLLKINPESVRRYVRSGKLKAVKLGGKFIRIEKKDLDDFLQRHR